MTSGHRGRSSGVEHDSAARRLDGARETQRRLAQQLGSGDERTDAQERLSAGRAAVAAREEWLHWIEHAESLDPRADGEWAPRKVVAAPRDRGSAGAIGIAIARWADDGGH
jgi:hypothetical protein